MATRPKGAGSLYYSADGRWRGTIEAGWTATGTRRRITVSAKTKAEAQRKMRDREREIARNGIPTEGSRRATTVKAWAEEWLPLQERTLRPQSYASTRSAVTKWIIPTIGHVKLATLNPGHIRSVHNAVRDAGLKPSSAVRTHAVLMALLNDALTEGGHTVPDAPLKVSGPKAGKSTRDAIPLEHALIVLQAALARPDASRWVAALLQALRPAEARGLTWAHIDFDADTIDISWQLKPVPYKTPRDRTSGFRVPDDYEATHLVDSYHLVRPKTDSGQRIIPMVPWMKAALLAWREAQGVHPTTLYGAARTVDLSRISRTWQHGAPSAKRRAYQPTTSTKPATRQRPYYAKQAWTTKRLSRSWDTPPSSPQRLISTLILSGHVKPSKKSPKPYNSKHKQSPHPSSGGGLFCVLITPARSPFL